MKPSSFIGQGIIGQLALRYARLAGAFPVIAVDISAGRLELSRRGGATHSLQGPIDQLADEITQINRGRAVDCVIEATGNPVAIPFALRLPRQRGRVIILGSPRGVSQVDFPTRSISAWTCSARSGTPILRSRPSCSMDDRPER